MCEYQNYYEDFKTGYWADQDAEKCKCRGGGWALSEVDTWHSCPVHYNGQKHPNDESADDVCEWDDADNVCLSMDDWKRSEAKWMDEWHGDGVPF